MIIAATSDLHFPKFFDGFIAALDRLAAKPDLFLLAGDMVHRGDEAEYERLHNALFGKIFCPIVACFGNNEFQEMRDEVKNKFKDIKFLDDSSAVISFGPFSVGIFGSTGSLETPTPWQKANVPNIERLYASRM